MNANSLLEAPSFRVGSPQFTDKLKDASQYSLILLIFSFIYLMIEILVLKITDIKIIILAVPIIITMTLGSLLAVNKRALEKWNNISLLVNPIRCTVTENYEDEYQVLVRIKNNLENTISCSIEMSIPQDIVVSIYDNEFRDIYNKKITLEKDGLYYLYLFLKSEKESDSIENMNIRLVHRMGKIEEKVVLFIRT